MIDEDLREFFFDGIFVPSPWMWENTDDPRLHPCFSEWLKENRTHPIPQHPPLQHTIVQNWTHYRCEHY